MELNNHLTSLTWWDRSAKVVSLARSSWVRGGPVQRQPAGCPWSCWWTRARRSSGCGREPWPGPETAHREQTRSHSPVHMKTKKQVKKGRRSHHDHFHSLGYRVGFVVLLLLHHSGEVAKLPDRVALLTLTGQLRSTTCPINLVLTHTHAWRHTMKHCTLTSNTSETHAGKKVMKTK